jgi:hypothetical protein
MRVCFRALVVVVVVVTLAAEIARAQPVIPQPRVHGILPLGARVGTQVEVRFIGDYLDGPPQEVFFSHPGITAKPVMTAPDRFYPQPRPVGNRFTVTVGKDVPPGLYEVRLANRQGITVARSFAVGDLPEISEPEPNDSTANPPTIPLDTVVNGNCDGRGVDVFRFHATKGKRLLIRCDAQKLDARSDLVLTLRDSNGNLVAHVHDPVRLDPLLDFTPPADGDYDLTVNDFLYRGGELYPYRLVVSTGPWIDYIDPPFATPGLTSKHTLYGRNLPGSTSADGATSPDGKPLEKLTVDIPAPAAEPASPNPAIDTLLHAPEAALPTFSYRLPSPAGTSNAVRLLLVPGGTNAVEKEPNESAYEPQPLTLPALVVGRFGKRNDRDWYSFTAKRGEQLWIEVTSQLLGLPTDPNLLVQWAVRNATNTGPLLDTKGTQVFQDVMNTDDQTRTWDNLADPRRKISSGDPALLFTAPADGGFRVLVQDLCGSAQGDPRLFYLLTIRHPQPDFGLVVFTPMPDTTVDVNFPGGALVRRNADTPLEVIAFRREGFAGEIQLSAADLPPGVTALSPAVIPKWDDAGAIVLHGSADAPPVLSAPIRVFGRARSPDGEEVVRYAQAMESVGRPEDSNPKPAPRAVRQFVLGVRDDAPASIVIEPAPPPAGGYRVPRGGSVHIPTRVTRTSEAKNDLQFVGVGGLPGVINPSIPFCPENTDKLNVDVTAEPSAQAGNMMLMLRESARIKYTTNPDAAALAVEDRRRIAQIQQQDTDALTKAEQARQLAELAVPTAQNELNQAEQRRQEALKAKTISPDAVATLDKVKADAGAKLRDATKTVERRRKDEADARKLKQESDAARQQVELRVAQTAGLGQAVDYKVLATSAPAAIQIVDAPFTLTFAPLALKAGATEPTTLPVTVKKDFSFDDEIRFMLVSPDGVAGVSLVTGDKRDVLAKGAAAAKPKFRADTKAPAGTHAFKLRCLYRFNGRDIISDLPLTVAIQPADQ